MRSPAPKQAESEFDDLLGQLADELALTPASQSGVSLVPDLEEPHEEPQKIRAASNAPASVLKPAPAKSDTTIVKVVGIIAASLTLVSVVALVVFGGRSDEQVAVVDDDAAVAAEADRDAAEATRRRAVQEARAQSIAAARAAAQAEFARVEAKRLSAALAEQAKPKAKPKPRKKPKPKPKQDLGSDFDSL